MTEWDIINYSNGKYHWFWQNSEDSIIELIFDSEISELHPTCSRRGRGFGKQKFPSIIAA